ncbi:MAG: 2-succinyl-5-enolpyruvyl-6-hydroxy-3-cyclohexene-1-carboxylic-acid synthase [Actinomycetota bacterium]
MNAGDWSLAYSKLLLEAFVGAGLTDVCVSPGARSTPLALAAWRDERLRVHVVLDERSAGFVAVGLSKALERPVAVVCTSGTAAANYLPAVVEAFHTNTRLIVLTSDRPARLRGTGANQTIDQRGLYKAFVTYEAHTPLPVDASVHSEWNSIASNAAALCTSGPVHINVAFDEPLVPTGSSVALPSFDPQPIERKPISQERFVRHAEGEVIAIVGGGAPSDAITSAVELGWPVFAEPQSNQRREGTLSTGALLFMDKDFMREHAPDLVVRFGAAPTSRSTLRLADSALVVSGREQLLADPHPEWLELWTRADALVRSAVDRMLDEWDVPFAGRIARDLSSTLQDGSALCVGSSMAIREMDAFMRPRTGLRIVANRGASGIDGFVSTAFGVALATHPTYALLGDLTLLHDAGGLIWNARRMPPVTFVVLNDDGGGIFSFTAQSSLPEALDLFNTPHGIDLRLVAEAAGCTYERVSLSAELIPSLERSERSKLIDVRIDRDDAVKRHAMIADLVHETLRGI